MADGRGIGPLTSATCRLLPAVFGCLASAVSFGSYRVEQEGLDSEILRSYN